MQILGIVNVTRDSFSDGGRFLTPAAAIEHAQRLLREGADIIDVGAESTHPDAEDVSAEEELRRLVPVVTELKAAGVVVSVDTYKPAVIAALLPLGVDLINDVTALRDPESVRVLRDSTARVILMHSLATTARATRQDVAPEEIVARICALFERRLADLEAAGIARERLILDPGMGFFIGRDPAVSLTVLREMQALQRFCLPLCICTSRKSFIGELLGAPGTPRPPGERGAGTLATELWAAQHGAAYIRTHAVGPLRDAWRMWNAVRGGVGPSA